MPPRKLILESQLALGDIVTLTAAVRDLHRLCPRRFVTDVRTAFPELWRHNPYLTALEDSDPDAAILHCEVPLINHSDHTPRHYLYGFYDFLNRRLDLDLEPTAFAGDIHLSEKERRAPSLIRELTGRDAPYWVICAGGRYDNTIKWWSSSRYQEVVDHFHGRIQFVQVGHREHYHPQLKGVIDLRGRTDLRQLILLVHHAQGILCGVTGLMHLAAAVPKPDSQTGLRPGVIIAGGREPAHWEAYPGHQFLHTVGALPCCGQGGCWKARTQSLGDGAVEDAPQLRCVDVVGSLPRCMHLLTSETVVRHIENYFEGGAVRYLTAGEARTAAHAMRLSGPSGFENLPLNLSSARRALEEFLQQSVPTTMPYCGRGIVICGGGARYFTNAWVCIRTLRRLGCKLPIQLWHLDREEIDAEMRQLMTPLQVECVDASRMRQTYPVRRLGPWELKPYALLYSPFQKVLLLDADNVPTRDPTFLFEARAFRETGALFWPDLGRGPRAEPIWRVCELEVPNEPEIESGQLVVDKAICEQALRLTLWFNENSDFFNNYLHGDKDTFALAFQRLKQPYRLAPSPPQLFPGGLYQHDLEGRRLFQHRNQAKWTLMEHNLLIPGFELERECLADLATLRTHWSGRWPWLRAQLKHRKASRVRGSSRGTIGAYLITCPEREETLRATLESLARSDWRQSGPTVIVDPEVMKDRHERICRQVLRAMQRFLDQPREYFLLLEDDLVINRHFHHNIQSWRPFRTGELSLGGLYNPNLVEVAYDVNGHAVAVDPQSAFGTQALLMSQTTVTHLVANWHTSDTEADLRIMRLFNRLGQPLYYHSPSLVQHRDQPSLSLGRAHTAPDFDLDWRA